MIGAIIGDIAGSTYEFNNIKTKRFPLPAPGSCYTDDSLMTIAVARALMRAGNGGFSAGQAISASHGRIWRQIRKLADFTRAKALWKLWKWLRHAGVSMRRGRHIPGTGPGAGQAVIGDHP